MNRALPRPNLNLFHKGEGLTLHYADPRHSTLNGQVERAHSTLTELARCNKEEFNLIKAFIL